VRSPWSSTPSPNLVIAAVLTAFFLADLPRIRATFYRLVPGSRRPRAILIGDEILAKVGAYVLGNVVISVITGVTTFVWLLVFGVPYPLLLAIFVAVFDVIPVVGSTIAGVVVAAVALTVSLPVCVATIAFFIAARLIEDYLLVPRIIGRAVHVPALVTVVAVQDLIDGKRLDATLGLPLSVVVCTVLGQPSPVVGGVGRITCSYGIPSPTGGYALQVSATSYRDEAAAAARVPVNVEALRTPGVNPIPIAVGQTTGMYLALPDGPVLLASAGTYSVTLTLGPTSFSPEQAPARAAAVAELVLSQVRA